MSSTTLVGSEPMGTQKEALIHEDATPAGVLEQRMKDSLSHARRGACGLISSPRTTHTHTARGLHSSERCVDR